MRAAAPPRAARMWTSCSPREDPWIALNHLNLTVTDVPAASNFLENYFGLRNMGRDLRMAVLTDDHVEWGFVLIGFFVNSRKTVNDVHRRLKEDGLDAPAPKKHNHGYGFYVKAPGGFTVELGA